MDSFNFNSLFSSFLVVLMILISPYFISPGFSTSRRALIGHLPKHDNVYKIGLQHVDYGKNLTKFERLQRAVKRSRHRMMKLSAMTMSVSSDTVSFASSPVTEIESSVHAGRGEFIMSLAIGTPPEPFTAIVDTGSDLIWTQCEPCEECYNQSNTPIFNPTKSSSFAPINCGSDLCNALPVTECSSSSENDDEDGISTNICSYAYQYGDYSSTEGVLATETFTFSGNDNDESKSAVSVAKIGFGCGNDNEGNGFNQADGLVGLGRGPLSLISQLNEPRFAYCLNPLEDKTSALLIGDDSITTNIIGKNYSGKMKTTPLGKSSGQPTFYYVNLVGISVGGKRLPIRKTTFELMSDGSGGMIIDSGTTITYLEQTAFDVLRTEFVRQMKYPVVDDEVASRIGLEVCFELPPEKRKDGGNKLGVDVPSVVFHFEGGVDLDLPAENYMVGSKSLGLVCLAMGAANSAMSIFGNVQQFNFAVVYDLRQETLSFVPAECDKLL